MDYRSFKDYVKGYVTYQGGVSFLDNLASPTFTENTFFNLHLQTFTARTKLLYSQFVALTLSNDVNRYDYRAVTFSPACQFADIEFVWTVDSSSGNRTLLQDFHGYPGPVPFAEFVRKFPNYLHESSSIPRYWIKLLPHTMMLYPGPDTSQITTLNLSGWILHPMMSEDDDTLSIPIQSIKTAAVFVAAQLLEPHGDADLYARMSRLDAEAAEEMRALEFAARRQHRGTIHRTTDTGRIYI